MLKCIKTFFQVKDVVPNIYPHYDGDYVYTLVHDSINNKSKLRHRREKGQPCKFETCI